MRRLLGAAAATAVGLVLVAPGLAHAAVPPLTGETLSGSGTSTTTFDCSRRPNYTNVYDSSGTATGPYPGTYTEQGSVTVKNGRVKSFAASFTIASGTTTITGTKSRKDNMGTGACGITGTVTWTNTAVYTATIQTPIETATDSGDSTVDGFSGGTITESFVSMP